MPLTLEGRHHQHLTDAGADLLRVRVVVIHRHVPRKRVHHVAVRLVLLKTTTDRRRIVTDGSRTPEFVRVAIKIMYVTSVKLCIDSNLNNDM